MARYAIGDIQGCMASLERLLALIGFSPSRDELWLVGDLVNRGPRSLDVLRWAERLGGVVTSVLGNHDLHLLARAAGAAGAKPRDTLDDVLGAPDRDRLIDWLRARPLLVVDGQHVLVHGGLHPQWTVDKARSLAGELETQLRGPTWRSFLAQLGGSPPRPEGRDRGSASVPRWSDKLGGSDRWRAMLAYLTRARTLKPDGRVEADFDGPPANAPAGCVPWFRFPERAWATHTIIFGHWAALGLDLGPHHVALDTGCVWGKQLTAFRIADRSVYQVKAIETPS